MRILVLPSWYPTRDDPVRGCFFREQAQALARAGHRVSVFPFFPDAPRGVYTEREEVDGAEEYAIHYRRLRFHLTFFRVLFAMIALWRSMPRRERPELMHVHSYAAMKYARWLRLLFRVPVVVTEHVSWFQRGLLTERQKAAIRRNYAAADAVLAVSDGLREQIQPLCRQTVRVVPNMVSAGIEEGGLRKAPGEMFRWISIGALNKNKGMDAALEAFALASKRIPAMTLTLCGGGDEREALERQAAELCVADKVTFTGQISRAECGRRLRECQAFLLASRVETFGIAAAEAMMCGLPVVMTKTSAWKTLIRPECGLAADADDIPALAEAMVYVTEHYGEYDPDTIAGLCRERFSEEAVTGQLTEIYRELVR